jgi:uncharacterized protein YegL
MMKSKNQLPEWFSIEPSGVERHLPVYLLLDISIRMAGEPLEALVSGSEKFIQEINSDPFARNIVRVGIITIDDEAQLITHGLVSATEFHIPSLRTRKTEITTLDLARGSYGID